MWKKIDLVETYPVYLSQDDECYYARDYIAGGGYAASEANQLITNLKKGASKEGTPEWKYKLSAVRQFSEELSMVLPDGITVVGIPASKCSDHPEYDRRIEWTLELLHKRRPEILVEVAIVRRKSSQALHRGGKRRISDVAVTLEWRGLRNECSAIALIDDIITCGTHFKACQRLILTHHPRMTVLGLFWGRTVWPDRDPGGQSGQEPVF